MVRTARTAEVAAALGLHRDTVQRYGREGRIPSDTLPSGHRRFDLDEVRSVLKAQAADRSSMRRTPVLDAIYDLRMEVAGLREMLRTEPELYTAELVVAGPVMISVEIRQDCYVSEPDTEKARPMGKSRLFITRREYPAVPRIGEYVALADGWVCVPVKSVYWEADPGGESGNVVIYLEDEHDLDEEHFRLLDFGWTA